METRHDYIRRAEQRAITVTVARGTAWGLIGGLVGTIVMDLVLLGALSAAGLPAFTCFSIVGNTVSCFFSELGIKTAGGVPAGVATHYLVGPFFGVIFGALVMRISVFNVNSPKKAILYAILFGEILSQPILATAPILLKMTALTTLKWYSGSFAMHLLWGVVVGIIVGYGLKTKNNSRILYPIKSSARLLLDKS